ncbi:ABC transporter ATP-binding protein [Paenibacillus planticolens]|uniref:ATP-binding cassette domain-containing protein n=1 Tax=Paenibacillus planticolens TaxID=2654976 RepID=A0ABX1ZN36_9BACL|nr:ATP-binding cassette domain-containing protein [Paenibacillus planticolens]NOV01509.1 ATP-binding cassette domain-containing protein [Paenibacillus planticolens]
MIKTSDLKKVYSDGETKINIQDIEFEKGKSYCILGPSGCGKSTLLNIIAGVVKPTTGDVHIQLSDSTIQLSNMSQGQLDKFRSNHVGYISQDFSLLDSFTIMDNMKLASKVGTVVNSPETAIEWVGLARKAKSKVKDLSGGEKQRVSIARALIRNPEIMLCDEPTASLNTKLAHEIIELLVSSHKQSGNTLIVVTHDDRLVSYFDHTVRFDSLLK